MASEQIINHQLASTLGQSNDPESDTRSTIIDMLLPID